MEVVEGTEADRKGGHIARRRADGALVLRETAQTPPDEADSFRDYRHWRYYNTNNLWIDLEALAARSRTRAGVFELPLIVNPKTVDPRDPARRRCSSSRARWAPRSSASRAPALCVPRTRFIPSRRPTICCPALGRVRAERGHGCRAGPGGAALVELDPRSTSSSTASTALPGGSAVAARRRAPDGARRRGGQLGERVIVRGDVEIAASESREIEDGNGARGLRDPARPSGRPDSNRGPPAPKRWRANQAALRPAMTHESSVRLT